MQRPRRILSTSNPVTGFLLILTVLTIVAACGAAGTVAPSPSAPASPAPSAPATPVPATPAPTAVPTATPGELPTVEPTGTPSDGSIGLDVADPHDVSVVVLDPEGALTGASSGRAGDGMSVRWGDVEIVNVDEDSLRVTWVGLPADAGIRLVVSKNAEGVDLAFTQPAPPANSDATGFDRVLVLDFAAPIRAADVQATFATAS